MEDRHSDSTRYVAIPPGAGTELDRLIAEPEVRHPGESGFRLVREGPEALDQAGPFNGPLQQRRPVEPGADQHAIGRLGGRHDLHNSKQGRVTHSPGRLSGNEDYSTLPTGPLYPGHAGDHPSHHFGDKHRKRPFQLSPSVLVCPHLAAIGGARV